MKLGDLVRFNYPIENQTEELIGIIVSDGAFFDEPDGSRSRFKDVWWMNKDRISPIKIEFLEVLSEGR